MRNFKVFLVIMTLLVEARSSKLARYIAKFPFVVLICLLLGPEANYEIVRGLGAVV